MALELANSVDMYLKAGNKGPFLGDLPYEKGRGVHEERKAAIKERGAKWVPNPEYVEGTKGVTRGWWAAPDRNVLLELLKLKPGDGMGSKALWLPRNIGPMGAALMLKQCTSEKAVADAADAQSRKRKEPSLADKEREERSRLSIPDDSPAEIAALLELGIVHSSELMERARRYASVDSGFSLGPRSGISDAARLLRGIKLGIVTVEEAKECRQTEEASVGVDVSALFESDEAEAKQTQEDLYKVVVKRRKTHLDDEEELGEVFDPGEIVGPSYADDILDAVTCERCAEQVSLQFMACGCAYSVWAFSEDGALVRRDDANNLDN